MNLCRTDRHPEQTRHLRRKIDDEIIGDGEDGRALGTVVEAVLKTAPGRVERGAVAQAARRCPRRRHFAFGGELLVAVGFAGRVLSVRVVLKPLGLEAETGGAKCSSAK